MLNRLGTGLRCSIIPRPRTAAINGSAPDYMSGVGRPQLGVFRLPASREASGAVAIAL
jgi:hypothetical protein